MKITYHQALTVLGATLQSSEEDIKKRYRMLAMKYHPDRNQDVDAEDKFKKAKLAFEYLESNPSGKKKKKGGKPRKTIKEGQPGYHPSIEVPLTLKEAFHGCVKTISLTNFNVDVEITVPPGMIDGGLIMDLEGMHAHGDLARRHCIEILAKIDVGNHNVTWAEDMWLYGGAKVGSGNAVRPIILSSHLTENRGWIFIDDHFDGKPVRVYVPQTIQQGDMLTCLHRGYWSDAHQMKRGNLYLRVEFNEST